MADRPGEAGQGQDLGVTADAVTAGTAALDLDAVLTRIERKFQNDVAEDRQGARVEDRRARVGRWLAGVSYTEWFALTARLAEAERERDEAQQWCVDEAEKHDATKTRLARAERRLSDYEQALRAAHDSTCGCDRPGNPAACIFCDWPVLAAALSGSTRPGEPEKD